MRRNVSMKMKWKGLQECYALNNTSRVTLFSTCIQKWHLVTNRQLDFAIRRKVQSDRNELVVINGVVLITSQEKLERDIIESTGRKILRISTIAMIWQIKNGPVEDGMVERRWGHQSVVSECGNIHCVPVEIILLEACIHDGKRWKSKWKFGI